MSASADQRRGPQPSASSEHIHLVLVFCIVFSLGAYCVLRYSARWAESDSSELTGVIRAFAEAGRLVPDGEAIYPNGVTYQAVSAVILALTGLDPLTLQQVVYPLLAAVVTVPAWMFYREVVGSARGATLATLLLFAQPEFLFVMLRSSHEKFSRSLMLLALYLFVRSFKLYRQPLAIVCLIVLSYP
ncbi:MAG: hypothetical protein HGA19_21570, partial [Oscillochloris sp.]|nr:hypothetical protein [Oscillochloris sp.]